MAMGHVIPRAGRPSQPPMIRRARHLVRVCPVGLDDVQVAPHHLRVCVPQDILQGKHVATVSQKFDRKRMPEPVGIGRQDLCPLAEPVQEPGQDAPLKGPGLVRRADVKERLLGRQVRLPAGVVAPQGLLAASADWPG
jgi:hypothetical protein